MICRDLDTPYSGMLPGWVAGEYASNDIHIQLAPLCKSAGARLVQSEVVGLDLDNQQVLLKQRPAVRYDLLSINTGAIPLAIQPGAVTVKPISQFMPKWRHLCEHIQPGNKLVFVGAGAGSVELALAARRSLSKQIDISVVGVRLLPGHGDAAQAKLQQVLLQARIDWVQQQVTSERPGLLELSNGEQLAADFVFWATQVCAPSWIKHSGLEVDADGFIYVNRYLQSPSHKHVFAAGDVAHLQGQPRAKSGVYAVRAGPYLAENLRRHLIDAQLKPFRAQAKHLALVGLGDGRALASRGNWASIGTGWWHLKQYIDLKFINKYNVIPDMLNAEPKVPNAFKDDLPEDLMRCGGCGAKLAADPLKRVLARLPAQDADHVRLGIGDDAAEIIHSGTSSLLTVDGFRAMVDDPYLFGRIVAHHSLNDIFAMGAQPTAGLAFVTIPLMAQVMMEEDLFQLLSGVTAVLNEHGAVLVGGHSAEGAELSVGLTVTGNPGTSTLLKGGAKSGQRLILTKPIGTGVVLAAAMQSKGQANGLAEVLRGMDQSNAPALEVFQRHQTTALTDITGFGLVGHLGEMLRASNTGAIIELDRIPTYQGALKLLDDLHSSLQRANEIALRDFTLDNGLRFDDPIVRLLADPQTSGGLLASVPADQSVSCCRVLSDMGYRVADIGEVTTADWILSRPLA